MDDPLLEVAQKSGRYSPDAFRFLLESLDVAVKLAGKEEAQGPDRHVRGSELINGLREHAVNLFGPLAAQVWRAWGVHETLDWGHIVFLLVDARLLNRQETDSLDDFRVGFDFDEVFVRSYRPRIPEDAGT